MTNFSHPAGIQQLDRDHAFTITSHAVVEPRGQEELIAHQGSPGLPLPKTRTASCVRHRRWLVPSVFKLNKLPQGSLALPQQGCMGHLTSMHPPDTPVSTSLKVSFVPTTSYLTITTLLPLVLWTLPLCANFPEARTCGSPLPISFPCRNWGTNHDRYPKSTPAQWLKLPISVMSKKARFQRQSKKYKTPLLT